MDVDWAQASLHHSPAAPRLSNLIIATPSSATSRELSVWWYTAVGIVANELVLLRPLARGPGPVNIRCVRVCVAILDITCDMSSPSVFSHAALRVFCPCVAGKKFVP